MCEDGNLLGYCAVQPWWWRGRASLKRRSNSTRLHGAISHKTVIFRCANHSASMFGTKTKTGATGEEEGLMTCRCLLHFDNKRRQKCKHDLKEAQDIYASWHCGTHRPPSRATQCPQGWHWCLVHRVPDNQAPWWFQHSSPRTHPTCPATNEHPHVTLWSRG
jgi:hypothetical protein